MATGGGVLCGAATKAHIRKYCFGLFFPPKSVQIVTLFSSLCFEESDRCVFNYIDIFILDSIQFDALYLCSTDSQQISSQGSINSSYSLFICCYNTTHSLTRHYEMSICKSFLSKGSSRLCQIFALSQSLILSSTEATVERNTF